MVITLDFGHSEYDKSQTGIWQVVVSTYTDVAQLSQSSNCNYYVEGSGRVTTTGQAVGTYSNQSVGTILIAPSSDSGSCLLMNIGHFSELGEPAIAFAGQKSEYDSFAVYARFSYSRASLSPLWHHRPVNTFEEDERTFNSIKDGLLKDDSYRGKYVAIMDGNVIDSDTVEGALVERCYRKYGYRPIYFNKVERIKRIIRLPSPRKIP